ncbi:MAG TPA: hypothetical protein VH877_02970 [Polyangia bacterium]|jgi:hypothetical protein|nr:hypothetical protein [Polyangia bacterium]
MNKRLEGYIRAGILFAWPLTWGGVALAQSVPGNGMAVPDVGSTGPVGASPSGSTAHTGEMDAPRDQEELRRSHLPPDQRIPPVNPGDQPPMPGSPQVAPPDTLHPLPATRPPEEVPPTPGAPRPGTANQTQSTPLPPDVVPRDAAAGEVRDVTPRSGRVKTSARRHTRRDTMSSKKGRRARHHETRPGSGSSGNR